jgi:small-conductance mechanosensitive channel
LRFVVADLTRSLQVQSEVRIAILEAFRAEGIEIPFSQHDIHLRDLDAFRSVLARVAEKAHGADGKQADKQPFDPTSPVGRED